MAPDFDPYYTWLAIRPEEQPANHYRLLGLRRLEDDPDVINNAVDQRVNYLQSVQSGAHSAQAERLIDEVRAAGECLLDLRQKAHYDRALLVQIEQAAAALAPPRVAAPAVEPSHAPQIPAPIPAHSRSLAPPAAKADPTTQLIIVATSLVAVAIVGVAVIAAIRWLNTPEPQVAQRPERPVSAASLPNRSRPDRSQPERPQSKPNVTPSADAPPAENTTAVATPRVSVEQPPEPPVAAVAEPTLTAAPPERIDLLSTADDKLRMPWGKFKRDGADLVLQGNGNALEFPLQLPAHYALEVDVIRETGDNSLCFTLPVDGRLLTAVVDGFNSKVSGLAAIDSREIFTPNNPHAKPGRLLTNGRLSTIRIEVSAQAVRLLVDRALVTEWTYDPDAQIRAAKGMGVSDPRKLTIFTWDARYRFKRIEVNPLSESNK